jgi:hypothetical protein
VLDNIQDKLQRAVQNLVFNCGGCSPGDKVLIVHETEDDGYFDPGLATAVSDAAEAL